MKNKIINVFLIFLSFALLGLFVFTYININYKDKGNIEVNNSYHEIKYTNVTVNDESMSVKVNDNNSLHIELSNVIVSKIYEITIDIKNIGNEDITIKNVSFNNINTNLNQELMSVDSSLKVNDIIKGGEDNKLIIKIQYNGINVEEAYYKFDIDYDYDK